VGIDPERFPGPVHVRSGSNIAAPPPPELEPTLVEVRRRYADDVERLSRLLPDLDLDRWAAASPS
jgi:hypothetical protein